MRRGPELDPLPAHSSVGCLDLPQPIAMGAGITHSHDARWFNYASEGEPICWTETEFAVWIWTQGAIQRACAG